MNVDEDAHAKKKADKPSENLTVSLDAKKSDKGDEESKPRIVLTFRSEKSNAKTTNMKIVSTEEKQEETPRRSSRTRGKWEWVCDSDTSPKKDKSGGQTASENDESDSSHTTPKRSTRRRSKDSDNVLANAIARKEKSYEQPAPTQRLSRRIKPTAKILANEELRIGLESQNNARLGIQSDKSPEEGVRTRRSARPVITESKPKVQVDPEVVEIATDEDSQSQNTVMKLKHLCELGLKAISPGDVDEIGNENRDEEIDNEEGNESDENEVDEIDDDEMEDDDPRVISKLLETDEDSSEDFQCAVETSQRNRPRRSTRLCSSYGAEDSDHSPSPAPLDGEQKPARRSSKRAARHSYHEESERSHRSKRRRNRSSGGDDAHSENEMEENSDPAGGDEGSEAACPADESAIVATCYCEAPSNVHADPSELTEPVFCQAIEVVDGVRVGCSQGARRGPGGPGGPGGGPGELAPLLRAGPRAPYFLACAQHAAQLRNHMCCPACGLFCSQGVFYQCSSGHLFHVECGLPNYELKLRPGCPHCGVFSYRWQPTNSECVKVKVEMKCSNKRIFLPDQREQCTPAYLGFSVKAPPLEADPVVPEDLLPFSAAELQRLCQRLQAEGGKATSPQKLCDAILAGETAEQLIPKIVSSGSINRGVSLPGGGSCTHAAAAGGRAAALCLLRLAGADLDATDAHERTPLMLAVLALLDKPDKKSKEKLKEPSKDAAEDLEVDEANGSEKGDATEHKTEEDSAKDENIMKVIHYLVAAGCDVNFPGPEGLTALHMAAQHGGARVCAALLRAPATNPDPRDHGGWTPLVWAAENMHTDAVRVLLEAGADAMATDSEGNGAVHWCALAGAAPPLQLLLRREPAAAHALNSHTDTPLHIAARQGHYACVVVLLAHGARTDVTNAAGELPVAVCSGQCQAAISLNMQMSAAVRDRRPLYRLLSNDISLGREPQPVPCVNELDDAPLPDDFTYVTRHVTPHPLNIETTLDSMQGCACKDGDCTSGACSCCALGVRGWYSRGRLLPAFPYHDPPMLFECNETCGCDLRRCGNSVVSRALGAGSVSVRAQVFRCGGARGWGLRAAARVQPGAPVARYCGELLPPAAADTRARDHYMFALDLKPDLLEQCTYKSQLCVDAAQYGSAARFINHSCRPNLAPVRVFTHTRDLRLPTVALFATTDILPGDEFTFDYGDKFWSVKSKWMKCECGSVDCRYPEKSTEDVESS